MEDREKGRKREIERAVPLSSDPKARREAEGKDCIKEEAVHRHGSLDQATKTGVSLIHRVFHSGCNVRSRSRSVHCA